MGSKSKKALIFWAKKVRRFLCFGLKKEGGCLCSGLSWLPAQVRLGAGSPADRMLVHRAGDVFGVAVSKKIFLLGAGRALHAALNICRNLQRPWRAQQVQYGKNG